MITPAEAEGSTRLDSKQSGRTDQELIAAANSGDLSAFEALYWRYRDWTVHLAWRFTRNEDLALDVLQEVFLYFLKKFPDFELRCELKTFLYPAVRNIAIAMRQKSERLVAMTEETWETLPAAPLGEGRSSRGALGAVLTTLPEAHREVLLLRFVDDLALTEIAAALDVPLGTVKSRLHNALAKLAEDPRTRGLIGE